MRSTPDTGMRAPLRFKLNFRNFRKFKPLGAEPGLSGKQAEEAEKEVQENEATDSTLVKLGHKPKIWSSFLAATFSEFPFLTPPDPSGAVGSSQVVVVTNASVKVFSKTNVTDAPLTTTKGASQKPAPTVLSLLLDDFFRPVLPDESFAADPHVRYDRLSKRWFFVAIEVNQTFENNYVLLAVSDGAHISQSTDFLFYRFKVPSVIPNSANVPFKPFLDYPTLGVDRNAVVVGGVNFFWNFFGADSVNFVGLVIDKKQLTRGKLLVYGLRLGKINYIEQTGYGMYVPQGVHNDDPAAATSFFAGITLDQAGLQLASVSYNAKGVPTKAEARVVPVEPFTFPRDVTAPGSPMPIDALDTRLFAAAIYKNKLTGKSALWTAHAIGVNQAGTYVLAKDFVAEARTASRWYEVQNLYSKPSVKQYGTVYDPIRTTGRRATSYFNPSIATNGQGYSIFGGTTSSYKTPLNVFLAGRFHEDASGLLSEPVRATTSNALYALVYGFYLGRWGDFSQTVVDPDDDQTIWTFQEYANYDDNYGTRAVQIKAPPPATPLPLGILSNRSDTVITIQGVSIDHSGFFDPGSDKGGPGYKRLRVKSTGDIIASNIKLINPTNISLKLNTKNKPGGTYPLFITNPDGQIVYTQFTIAAPIPKSSIAARELTEIINSLKVYPNPTPGEFRLQLYSPVAFSGRVLILDLAGKQLQEQKFNLLKGNNDVGLSVAAYANGTYIAAVYTSSNTLVATQVIVKQ